MGTLGAITGVLLLMAGILLLIRSKHSFVLIQSAAYVSVPVYLILGVWKHYTGWPVTLVGIAYPLLLLTQKFDKPSELLHKT